MHTLRTVLLLTAMALIMAASAQAPSVLVYGTVKDMATRDSIPQATIRIGEGGGDLVALVANARGRYEFELTGERTYLFRYGAPGKVGKSVVVDTRGPTPEEWEGGFGMNIDVTLMDSLPGVDYGVLREPLGISRFNRTTGNYEWDLEHTRSMAERQKALFEAYRERMSRQGDTER